MHNLKFHQQSNAPSWGSARRLAAPGEWCAGHVAHATSAARVRSIYVLQFGGGGGPEASLSCGGDGRITRFPLQAAADNSSLPVDVVNALVAPRFLALDPLFVPPLLFWTDPGFEGGSVMRANADGTYAVLYDDGDSRTYLLEQKCWRLLNKNNGVKRTQDDALSDGSTSDENSSDSDDDEHGFKAI